MTRGEATCEVLVLGGGPAGAAAAITAAAAGLSVTLIERDASPRPAPGESLHPGVQPLLRQLGVEGAVLAAGFLRHPGHVVRWGGADQYQPFGADAAGPWLGFQAWRPTFDALLLDRAKSLGVTVRRPCRPTGVVVAGGRVVGVETTSGRLTAGVVVDATGRGRAVSRWLGLTWRQSGPARRAWYGYASGPQAAAFAVPALRADAGGWTWVARVRPETCAWTRMNFDATRPAAGWRPPELAGMAADGPARGADVTWRAADRPAGPGYVLAGDAAAALDPAASHGVLKALMSGIAAGRLAADARRGAVPERVAAEHYSHWVGDWFDRDVSRLDELYARLPGTPAGTPVVTPAAGPPPPGGFAPPGRSEDRP